MVINLPAPLLYHYTSGTGLLGILESDSIWATQIHYLNDSKEFAHAIELARAQLFSSSRMVGERRKDICVAISDLLEQISKMSYYVACFSEAGDSLSQWRGYCPPGFGYSIGFDQRRLQTLAQAQGFKLSKCIYNLESQQQIIGKWTQSTLEDLTATFSGGSSVTDHVQATAHKYVGQFAEIASILKYTAFEAEREWRMVSLIRSDDPRVNLRPTRSMLAPYVAIKLGSREEKNLIEQITVGPTPHSELAVNSVSHLFNKAGVKSVRPSTVPYRDW
jgi:hypothetical protein